MLRVRIILVGIIRLDSTSIRFRLRSDSIRHSARFYATRFDSTSIRSDFNFDFDPRGRIYHRSAWFFVFVGMYMGMCLRVSSFGIYRVYGYLSVDWAYLSSLWYRGHLFRRGYHWSIDIMVRGIYFDLIRGERVYQFGVSHYHRIGIIIVFGIIYLVKRRRIVYPSFFDYSGTYRSSDSSMSTATSPIRYPVELYASCFVRTTTLGFVATSNGCRLSYARSPLRFDSPIRYPVECRWLNPLRLVRSVRTIAVRLRSFVRSMFRGSSFRFDIVGDFDPTRFDFYLLTDVVGTLD
jgi:hypothetical protein